MQIIVGILYSLVTSRAVFFQIFPEKSIHRQQHTVKGWAIWATIVSVGWIIAFVIAESSKHFLVAATEGSITYGFCRSFSV